jgi:hypothetical protein
MLTLNPEQTEALAALIRQRDLALLAEVLGEAFPEVPGRLGDRLPALVALATQRDQALGLTHLLFTARHLACWVALGADFEARPGGEWAAALLADAARSPASRVHALCRRTRERLAAEPQPGRPTAAAFDAGIALMDRRLQAAGDLAALGDRRSVRMGQPCDLDAVDLQLVQTGWRQQYAVQAGQWQRAPGPAAVPGVTLRAGVESPWPALVTALSLPAGREGLARLRLRTHATNCCDPEIHPLVTLATDAGLREWRGPLAADATWALPSNAQPVDAIAAEGSPTIYPLLLGTCGLRDQGAAVGELKTAVAVYPAEQHLLAWRREPLPTLQLPAGAALPPPLPRCRYERDGQTLPTARWLTGLQALDAQITAGMARLLAAWERDSGASAAALDADIGLLTGAAGLSWGWAERPAGLSAPPYLRVVGLFEQLACRVQVALTGRLSLQGSQSVLTLTARGEGLLPATLQRGPDDDDLGALLPPLQISVVAPFALELTSVADPGLATMTANAPGGGLLVQAGLRARPDGPGLQWFAKLSVEPARLQGVLYEPLLGQLHFGRPLLPAMTLVDWSLA